MEMEHTILKRRISTKNVQEDQPKNSEVNENIMEIGDQANPLLSWDAVCLRNNYLIEGTSSYLKLHVFEDNSITLHHTNFDPRSKKLQIGTVRVNGKKLLENNSTALDVKELRTKGAMKFHDVTVGMLKHFSHE